MKRIFLVIALCCPPLTVFAAQAPVTQINKFNSSTTKINDIREATNSRLGVIELNRQDHEGRVDALEGKTSNINNTSDANKPVSTATQTALDLKANATSFSNRTAFTTAWGWNPGDGLGSATAANVSSLFSGSGDCLRSDGTKGDCGTGGRWYGLLPTLLITELETAIGLILPEYSLHLLGRTTIM